MTIKKNVEITVSSKTRQVFFEDNFLGLTGENLQGYVVFSFKDGFVSGIPRVELIQGDQKYYITEIETENETYKLPIKSSLLTSNNVQMQLVITESGEENSIPIFKSKTFYLYVAESINAVTTIPEEYATWIDTLNEKVLEINAKLDECDTAISQANNLDIDISKSSGITTVTVTKKDGTSKSEDILDATINGINTVTMIGGTNIEIEQEDSTLTINNTYDDSQILSDISDLQTNKADKTEIPDVSSFITKDVNNLTYYTLATNTGSTIELSINSSTYVMTLNLKNSAGTTISSGSIDLPLETMVVGASYDSDTKEIVLTLKNGQTIRFSVADLVSGLQTEITSDNKLASDLVDDTNQTNKFVTASDISAWNAKLDQSDLADYVKNTDYATSAKGGVIKTDEGYGTTLASTGAFRGVSRTNAQYNSSDPRLIISKGTLENVITGKNLETANNKTTELTSSSTDTQYPSAKCVYDSQEEQNTVLEEQSAEIERLKANQPRTSATGVNINVDDALDGEVLGFEMHKETTQNTVLLPSEYTEVDYIEGTGTQYIDTGVVAKTTTTYDLYASFPELPSATRGIIGVLETGSFGRWNLYLSGNGYISVGYSGSYYNSTVIPTLNTKYHLVQTPTEFKIGNNSIVQYTVTSASSSSNVYIYKRNYTSDTTCVKMKLYSCKIYDGDTLVRDFKPCYRNSDSVVGLYDLVNDVFYTNAGTGSFTYGATYSTPTPSPDYPQEVNVVEGYKNLFDINGEYTTNSASATITNNTLKITSSGAYARIVYELNVTTGKTYTLTTNYLNPSNNSIRIIINDADDTTNIASISAVTTSSGKFALNFVPISNKVKIRLYSNTLNATNTTQVEYSDIQVIEGTEEKPYVPYGNNYVTVDVVGKNLLNNNFVLGSIKADGTDASNSTRARSEYTKIEENKTYNFSSSNSNLYYVPYFYDKNKTFLSYSDGWKAQSTSFTTPANTKYIRIIVKNNNTDTITLSEITQPMIRLSTENASYEPYQYAKFPLNLNNNWLAEKGAYQDKYYIDRSTGKHYILKQWGKVILNGTENWEVSNLTDDYLYFITDTYDSLLNVTANNLGIMDRFSVLPGWDSQTNGFTIRSNASHFRIRFDKTKLSDISTKPNAVASFKTWLSNNLPVLYYVLATPTLVEVPATDIELFNGINNISNSEGATMKIEYVQDINIVINKLTNAILEIGGE